METVETMGREMAAVQKKEEEEIPGAIVTEIVTETAETEGASEVEAEAELEGEEARVPEVLEGDGAKVVLDLQTRRKQSEKRKQAHGIKDQRGCQLLQWLVCRCWVGCQQCDILPHQTPRRPGRCMWEVSPGK